MWYSDLPPGGQIRYSDLTPGGQMWYTDLTSGGQICTLTCPLVVRYGTLTFPWWSDMVS